MVHITFENPRKKPLNELILSVKEDGIQRDVPALDEKWKEPRCYTKYIPLPIKDDKIVEGVQLEEWINEVEWFNKDIEWILELEHYRFWSTVVYDPACMETIISFTQEATPFYLSSILSSTLNTKVRELHSTALKNVFKVICRLITQKESDQCWIKKDFLAEIIYKKYLFSIPLIFDLITAYGRDNASILTVMVQTIFKIQPKYLVDLKIGLQYFKNAFQTVQKKIESDGLSGNLQPISALNDLALYTLDCAATLSILVEILPEAQEICSEIQMEQSISNFYDSTIVLLYKNIYAMDSGAKSLEYLNNARIELIKCFRVVLNLNLEKVLVDPDNSLLPADKFLCILTECLSDQIFVKDYQKHYPVEYDLEILKQACKNVDTFKLDFVQNAYCYFDLVQENGYSHSNDDYENGFEIDEEEGAAAFSIPSHATISAPAPSPTNFEDQIEIDVRKVLDILPHLGDGFIRKILPRYDNVEAAISAILESNLPPDLADADKNEPYIPSDKLDNFYLETGVDRLNIFDGDEFDVLVHDKVKGIIKKGKGFPGQPKTIGALLDDKSHVKEMKMRYQEYQNICDDYDDEYDDSYDALADTESKTVKVTAAMKNILVDELDDDESEDEEEEIAVQQQKNSTNFCENPEAIRQRYEDKRRAKMEMKGGQGQGQGYSQGQSNKDVVGKPKGQGQEKSTVINRNNKNTNKASRANHNRKQGATFKRNKGMIPS